MNEVMMTETLAGQTVQVCDGEGHPTPARRPRAVSDAGIQRAAGMLHAAGDPSRLRILELLTAGELCVTAIADAVDDALPNVSQRVRLLKQERLLRSRREGKHVFYALADGHVADLIQNVLSHADE